MTHKQKSWLWKLTFPFAHGNYTTVGDTIYYPKKFGKATGWVLEHEKYHIKQQAEVGAAKFILLYLFCLPVLFNPWRKKWETEAYLFGSMWTDSQIRKVLRSSMYGWIL